MNDLKCDNCGKLLNREVHNKKNKFNFCNRECNSNFRRLMDMGIRKGYLRNKNYCKTCGRLTSLKKEHICPDKSFYQNFTICPTCHVKMGKTHDCSLIHKRNWHHHTEKSKKLISDKIKILVSEGRIKTFRDKEKLENAHEKYRQRLKKGDIHVGMYGKHHKKESILKGLETKRKNGNWTSLERNGRWLGGKSFEPYNENFNINFKNMIKERDGMCMICNIPISELKLLNRQVDVHHINYDKMLSINENCITLCVSCHAKTNQNREHWKSFFQSLLFEKYRYIYSEKKDIVLSITSDLKGGNNINGKT